MLKRLLGAALLGFVALSFESGACMRRGAPGDASKSALATELGEVADCVACSQIQGRGAIAAFAGAVLQAINAKLAASVCDDGVAHTNLTAEDIFLDLSADEATSSVCFAKWTGRKWQFTLKKGLFEYYLGEVDAGCFDWYGIKKRVANIDWVVEEMSEAIQRAARRKTRT